MTARIALFLLALAFACAAGVTVAGMPVSVIEAVFW